MFKGEKLLVVIIGSAKPTKELEILAEQVGRLLAQKNTAIICGGLTGVMEASCRGAKTAGGLTIGILPGISSAEANPYIDIAIPTGISEARNLIIIRSSHALIAIGGGYGTLSEIAFALKLNVPVIGLKTWNLDRISLPPHQKFWCGGKEPINIIPAKNAGDAVKKAIEGGYYG